MINVRELLILALICMLPMTVIGSDTVNVDTLAVELDGAVGGVAVDQVGYIYVADFGNKVWRVDPQGQVEVFADDLYGASGNSIDSQGRLLQSNFFGNNAIRISRDGTAEQLTAELNGPVGIVELSNRDIAICNCSGNEVVRLDQKRELTIIAKSDLFNCPNGLVKGSDESLYVANFSDGRVIKIDPEGKASVLATIQTSGLGHLVIVGSELFVTGFRSNQLYRVQKSGNVQVVAGNGQFKSVDGHGQEASFSSPNGIAYSPKRDELYINDYLVPFIQRSRAQPKSALRRVVFPTLTETFMAADKAHGIEKAIEAHRTYKESRPGKFTQIETNIIGYSLLQQGRTDDAIQVFTRNTEDYPNSFNTWDSLAEGFKVKGDKKEAIEYYQKSLQLNPANNNAVNMLKELGVSQ